MPRFQHRGAGVLFTVDVQGEKQLSAFIAGIGDKVKDLSPIWNDVDAILRKHVKTRFSTRGGGREPWPPLSPSTLAAKKKAGYPATILVRTGKLKRALTLTGGEHIFSKARLSMTFGADIRYADFHQSPLEPRRRLSRRAFFFIGTKETSQIIGRMRKHVEGVK